MKKQFTDITEIYDKSARSMHGVTGGLANLRRTFAQLEVLNQILRKVLPANLTTTCHVGAIDYQKNTVVIFVSNQMAMHLLRNFTNDILQAFTNAHFAFDKILMRVGIYNNK